MYDVQELVIEKESRIRESMLMMGLRQWVLWASWFIKQLLFMSVWVLAFPILMKVCYSTARNMYVYIVPVCISSVYVVTGVIVAREERSGIVNPLCMHAQQGL